MFKSIRWKFITVYFLLVYIAMVIVGAFIIEQFERQQIEQISKSMKQHIDNIYNIVTPLHKDDWSKVKEEINAGINKVSLGYNESLYIVMNSDDLEIIGSKSGNLRNIIGQKAYETKKLNKALISQALKGEIAEAIPPKGSDGNDERVKHIAYPILNNVGQVKGIIYLTSKLDYVDETINSSKIMLTEATILALVITVILGFFIAKSITGPIKDVTVKAEKMAKGDFNQVVEVKSDDEIGQLANMFNYLTQKLKKTISEVYREKSKMDTIFTYMADGVVAVNTNGEIIHANPVALKILNLLESDINTKKFDEVVRSLSEKITLEYIKNSEKWEGDVVIELRNSTYRAKYAPFKNDKNQIGGLIVVFQDITEQHRLESMRKEFVANVSHELKTPITTIKSYTETLLEGAVEDKQLASQFLNVINSESDRMARIVRDLLQLSNLDYKQTKWNKVTIPVKEMLEEIYLKMKISAQEKGQTLSLNIEDDMPEVIFDKDGFEQVILNIVSNAIKYTPNNGNIEIKAFTQDDNILIKVKDDGIGIPKEDLDRIFERFYRVDKARSRELGGTGLGLSIAKQIVEAHNGEIQINSEFNVGTEVDIIVPAKKACVIQT
ncbi:sensor histidine kinase [Caldisalinibacter kiritimatiensis]|uniref:histidine kinase n=1 Tax=Caldisalinibacter kiritimatiensis TaxID=1304284 RepID=R1CU19_9FIRM|nr:ATP-binding protein [Caldisalinibacter kiritimatiensis]EOD00184.1 Two-component sensor kinase SA14-24 [Caldisalinibacter kiritimatiensis]